MLSAGYKHNVIPEPGHGWHRLAGSCRVVEDEFYATIADLIGDKVRYEVVTQNPSVETEFAGRLVDANAGVSPRRRIPVLARCRHLFSGGTRWQGLAPRWHQVFRFCSAPLAS